jgi:peroxiredoxin
MTIAVGDRIPDVEIRVMGSDKPEPVRTGDVLGRGKVVLFAVPGAFTPTCSDYHLPGYVIRAGELRAKGVDTVACLSVNDPYVMDAWGDDQEVGDAVVMLADGNGTFTRAMGRARNAISEVRGCHRRRDHHYPFGRAHRGSDRQFC